MSSCDNLKCTNKITGNKYLGCPDCNVMKYCSIKCKELDKPLHQNECTKSNVRLNSNQASTKNNILDEYETVKNDKGEDIVLGKGTFGDIKLIKNIKTNIQYALKTVFKESLKAEKEISYLKNEIRLLKQITHPNILKLVNSTEDPENVYIIMEYASNHSVFSYIQKKQRLSDINAFVLFIQACLAVDHLHKIGFIHRDINSNNLWIDSKGNLKLSDLGWCGKLGNPRLTYCGSFDYMAPEVLDQREQTEKTDVWCLGILLYEMVVGKTPYPTKNQKSKLEMIKNEPLNFPENLNIPEDLKSMILFMIKENPLERPSLPEVLKHPWILKNAKIHNIDIGKYLQLSTVENHALTQAKESYESIVKTTEGDQKIGSLKTINIGNSQSYRQISSFNEKKSAPAKNEDEKLLKNIMKRMETEELSKSFEKKNGMNNSFEKNQNKVLNGPYLSTVKEELDKSLEKSFNKADPFKSVYSKENLSFHEKNAGSTQKISADALNRNSMKFPSKPSIEFKSQEVHEKMTYPSKKLSKSDFDDPHKNSENTKLKTGNSKEIFSDFNNQGIVKSNIISQNEVFDQPRAAYFNDSVKNKPEFMNNSKNSPLGEITKVHTETFDDLGNSQKNSKHKIFESFRKPDTNLESSLAIENDRNSFKREKEMKNTNENNQKKFSNSSIKKEQKTENSQINDSQQKKGSAEDFKKNPFSPEIKRQSNTSPDIRDLSKLKDFEKINTTLSSKHDLKNMEVIVETEEKETIPTNGNNPSNSNISKKTPKTKKSKKRTTSKKKNKEISIESQPFLKKKSISLRESLDNLNQKKEGKDKDKDSGWCSKTITKKKEDLTFFERIAVVFGCYSISK